MAEIIAVQGFAGAGKTTHSEYVRLNYMYNGEPIEHVSIGDRLRAIRMGLEDSRYTELVAGLTAPVLTDEDVTGIAFERINRIPKRHLVVPDGYPREAGGVAAFAEAAEKGGHKVVGSLFLDITREVSIARVLARGVREGEILRKGSLEEEAARRYARDAVRLDAAMRSLGEIASVQVVDMNVGVEEARERFIGAIGQLGVVLNPKFPQKAAEYAIDPHGNIG